MTLTDIPDAMELCSRLTLMAKGTETCNYHSVNIKIILGYYRKFGSYMSEQHKEKYQPSSCLYLGWLLLNF